MIRGLLARVVPLPGIGRAEPRQRNLKDIRQVPAPVPAPVPVPVSAVSRGGAAGGRIGLPVVD